MMLFWLLNPINDISTSHPVLLFEPVAEMEQASKNQYEENFRSIQDKLFPDLGPFVSPASADLVFNACLKVAQSFEGWDLYLFDEAKKVIQGTDTTPTLKFKDDFVIRIESDEEDNKTIVHMRSKSRLGRNDFGKNAERIQQFFAKLNSELTK